MMSVFAGASWQPILFPTDSSSELGQRLGISYVRTLQEKVVVLVGDRELDVEQSSLGMMAISSVVWDCGLLLVDYLSSVVNSSSGPPSHAKILELGCGTGLVGISAHLLGASKVLLSDIVLTDGLERYIQPLESVSYVHYDWNDPDVPSSFTSDKWDVVLCSDVLYESKNHPALLRLIGQLQFDRLLLAYKRRHDKEELQFFQSLAQTHLIRVVDSASIPLRNLKRGDLNGLFVIEVQQRL